MRSRFYAVFRLAAVFVALEVADLPILCGDEWSGAAAKASMAPVGGAGEPVVSSDASDPGDSCCYCPCHMSFAGTAVEVGEGLRFAKGAAPDPLALPLVSRPSDIEHPPQNLF